MIGVQVIGADQVARRLAAAVTQTRAESERAIAAAAVLVQREVKTRMSARTAAHPFWGRMGSSEDGRLGARTGHSRARVTASRAFRVGGVVQAVVGTGDKHIAFLEQGGEVRGNPYLRIPTREMKTAQGVDRLTGRSARSLVEAFLFRSKRGNLWIGMRDRRGALTPLYMLVRSITVKGRHLFEHARRSSADNVQALVQGAVTRVVRGANGGA